MKKILGIGALAVSVAVALTVYRSADNDLVGHDNSIAHGKYAQPVAFQAPSDLLVRYEMVEAGAKEAWELVQEKRPLRGRWSVWIMTDYWSDYAPFQSNRGDGYMMGASIMGYSVVSDYLSSIKRFRTSADLDFDINVVAYGTPSQFLMSAPFNPHAGSLAFDGKKCRKAFQNCADHFYFSPADFSEPGPDSAWIKYLSHYVQPYVGIPADSVEWKNVMRTKIADTIDVSKHRQMVFVRAPEIVLIVNPDGNAVYGWTGMWGLKNADSLTVAKAIVDALNVGNNEKVSNALKAVDPQALSYIRYHGLHFEDYNLGNLAGNIRKAFSIFAKGQ